MIEISTPQIISELVSLVIGSTTIKTKSRKGKNKIRKNRYAF
jgi:hypothetical protein